MMKNNASLVSMWKKKDLLVGQLILGERKYSSMKKKKKSETTENSEVN